jgi:hypothetical protein
LRVIGVPCRPHAHERHLALVRERHDRDRDRRVEAAEQAGDLLALHQFARRDRAFRRVAFIVAHQQLDLLAEHAALGVDLVDRDGEPAHDRLAGLGRLAGHRGDQAELQGVLRQRRDGEDGDGGGEQQAAGEVEEGDGDGHGATSRVNFRTEFQAYFIRRKGHASARRR